MEEMMKSDLDIRRDVEEELDWDPDLDPAEIGVAVKNGIVTLTGFVSSYKEKFEAEKDAKHVKGVVGVVDDINVRVPTAAQRPDLDIASDAIAALKTALPLTHKDIKVIVRDGWITLEGEAEWNFLRETAHDTVRGVKGIQGVVNLIQLKPKAAADQIKQKIEQAFRRNAEVDANNITVETRDGEVTLKGTVHSWFERQEAESAAWRAPGVTKVEDHIVIRP
jgi:osmotically-inducible protein OsmY